MARKRKLTTEMQPIGVGMTSRQMKRKRPINIDMMLDIEPLTENQEKLFESYKQGKHFLLHMVQQELEKLSLFFIML